MLGESRCIHTVCIIECVVCVRACVDQATATYRAVVVYTIYTLEILEYSLY